jgi:hypothetical protein
MEIDEGSKQMTPVMKHANVEAIDDEEFFEFEEVESVYNAEEEGANTT